MEKAYCLLFVLCSVWFSPRILAQTMNSNQDISVIPPPPDVASLAQVGLSRVNYSDGGFNASIPLYTYKTKNLSVPISLSYSTHGLKVDEISGIAGLDWNLVAGGNVGRMVLGNDDFLQPFIQYPVNWPNVSGDSAVTIVDDVTNNAEETQPDIYNLSYNGISARFLLINNQIIKLEQNSLNIQYTGGGFKVTDNNGITYLFTLAETSLSSSTCSGHPYTRPVTNAWLLTSIVHPLGDAIYFAYAPVTYTYSTGLSQTYIQAPSSPTSITACPDACPTWPGTLNENCVSNLQYTGYVLTSISSNAIGSVTFSYGSRTDVPGDQALDTMTVYNGANSTQTVTFNYSTVSPNSTYSNSEQGTAYLSRMFLQSLSIGNHTSADSSLNYTFTYNNLSHLPQRLSFAQDDFGYFNGKNTNLSLIPSPANYDDMTNYNDFSYAGYGNRNPDGSFAVTGTLSKIQYPTGGYDTIIYEPNSIYNRSGYNCTNPDTTLNITASATAAFHTVDSSKTTFTIHCPQNINISLIDTPTVSGYPNGTYLALVDIEPATGGQISVDASGNEMQATPGNSNIYQVNLNPGTYSMVVHAQGPAKAQATFSCNDVSDSTGELEQSGVRVQQIWSYPVVGQTPVVKSYQYTNFNTNVSSGIAYLSNPSYQTTIDNAVLCPATAGSGIHGTGNDGSTPPYDVQTCSYYSYSNSNFYNLYTYTGNNIYYSDVTELDGAQGQYGAIEHKFQVGQDVNAAPLVGTAYKGAPLSNFGIYNGFEYDTRYYKSRNDSLVLVKDVSKHEQDDQRLSVAYTYYAFKADPGLQFALSVDTPTSIFNMAGIHVMQYSMLSRWLYPDTVRTTEYYDNGTSLTSTEVETYNNPIHQELSEKYSINSKGDTLKDFYYYPLDSVTATDTMALAAKYALENDHIWAPVLEDDYYNGMNLMRKEENYFSNDLVSYAPMINRRYITQSGVRDLPLTYTNYGIFGDLTSASKAGNQLLSFIWDYKNTYPIAQVKNAVLSDIAYTSFEADGSGNWTIPDTTRIRSVSALTGSLCYNLTGSNAITSGTLNTAQAYIVGYWGYTGSAITVNGSSGTAKITLGNWTYYEVKDSAVNKITISGTGMMDELRLYPNGALMDTYTYTPMVGATTHCDPSSRLTYYSYDYLDRLKLIKDQYGNILKRNDYEYQVSYQQ
jgi:hypothetical protein